MSSSVGPGFWIDPDTNKVYNVSRHETWLRDKVNQRAVGLPQNVCDAIDSLDPVTKQDEIRLLGLRAGLIRVRDYNSRLSVQFFAPRSQVRDRMWTVLEVLPQLFSGASHYLTIHNMYDDSSAEIETGEFKRKMKDDEPILREDTERIRDIPSNRELQEAVNKLIGPPPS